MDTFGSGSKPIEINSGVGKIFKDKLNYSLFHALIILIVVCISLYNLTMETGDQQLWRDLLMFTFGLVIPTPNSDKIRN